MTSRELKYLIAYAIPIAGFFGIYLQGFFSYGVVLIAFVFIPLVEFFTPNSTNNLSEDEEAIASKNKLFDYLLYLHLPLLYALLTYFFYTIQTTILQPYEIIGLTLSMGLLIGTFGINIGHELGHRSTVHDQLIAKLLLLPALYMHFNIRPGSRYYLLA